MKNMSKGKKRILRTVSLVLVAATMATVVSNLNIARSLSLQYIEQIKKDYSDSSFKVLEIASSSDNGTIGYYAAGEEPVANWADDVAQFSGKSVRAAYVKRLIEALKDHKLLGDDDSTPLRMGSAYKEMYPWEDVTGDNNLSNKKTVTALLREENHENDYNEMKLANSEMVSSYITEDDEGHTVSTTVTGTMTSLTSLLEAADEEHPFEANISEFEYNAKYNYRLADSTEKNLFNYYDLTTKLGVSTGETYRTTRIIKPDTQNESITVFGTTQQNWAKYHSDNSVVYDMTKTYAQGGNFYSIPVEAGATYKISFKAKVISNINNGNEVYGNGKAQITVIPYTQANKTISYSPNNSKQYWLLNKYISQPAQTSSLVDSQGFAEYTYYFTTPITSNVSYIQVRFDVAELTTSAVFKQIKVNKYAKNYFNLNKWAGNQKNLVNGDPDSRATITADTDAGRISVKMTKGQSAYTPVGTSQNLYYIEVEPYTQYILTYHVEDTLDDGGRSVVRVLGFDADMKPDFEIPKESHIKGIRQDTSDSYSVEFVTGVETKYVGISFGVESKTKLNDSTYKNVSHTSVYSNIAVVKAGDFDAEEPPTHVQNIDYFTYGQADSNSDAKLGENIFNFGDWMATQSAEMSGGCYDGSEAKGSVTTDYAYQTVTITANKGQSDVYTNYTGSNYYTGFYYLKVTPGMKYKFSYHVSNNLANYTPSGTGGVIHEGVHSYVFGYDMNKLPINVSSLEAGNVLGYKESTDSDVSYTFDIPSGCEYIQIRLGSRRNSSPSAYDQTAIFSNIEVRPYDQTSYYYNVNFTKMDDYYIVGGEMSTKGFEYDESTTYYYNATTYKSLTFTEIEALEKGTEVYTRDEGYVEAGIVGEGFTFDSAKTYYRKGLIDYNEISDTSKVAEGVTVYTYEQLSTYTLAGKKDIDLEVETGTTYYLAESGFHTKPITEFTYDEKVYTKSGDSDYVLAGTIAPIGFTLSEDTELYTREANGVEDGKTVYKYTQINDWSKIKYGTVLYSYFYDLAIYKEDKRTGHEGEYIYVGKIGRDYTYAGTFDTDEFEPDPNTKYYVYDAESDKYTAISRTEMEAGMVLFTESTVFKGYDSSYEYADTYSDTFVPEANKDYFTFNPLLKVYNKVDFSKLTSADYGTPLYVQGAAGYTYMDANTDYYYATINYDYDGCPISAIWDEDHPYCVTTSDFREATGDEVPYFIEDGIDHYIYVGSGNGEYRYEFGIDPIVIETDTVFYQGGYTNNNWMLRYVFDYTEDEIAANKDSYGRKVMGLSVTTVDPTVLNNMIDEDLEAYLGQFDLIVITSGLSVMGSTNFNNDLSDSSADMLKEIILGSLYETPCIVDTALFNIEYKDRYGATIENIPKLAKELCEEISEGGVVDHIYRFNSDDLKINPATDNFSIANEKFRDVIDTYSDGDADLEIKPYYDVFNDIKTENALRSASNKLTNDKITEATAIRTILNARGRQKENHKEHITVLELQPYTASPATGSRVESGKYGETPITSDSGLTKEMVKSWFPESANFTNDDITIKTMAVSEFIGRNEDISEIYDILYIGSSLTNMNYRVYGEVNNSNKQVCELDQQYEIGPNGEYFYDTADDGTVVKRLNTEWQKVFVPNYNDDEMDGLYYSNIGDLYYVQNGTYSMLHTNEGVLGGLMESDYHYASLTKGAWEIAADDESKLNNNARANLQVRSAGNDITLNKLADITDFIDGGHPVVLSSTLCENDWSGSLDVSITGTIEVDASGNSWAKLVAKYTGDKLPSGVQPKYTWYIDGQQLKETDKEYQKYVTYSDLDNDGLREGIYRFPLEITKVDSRYNKEYYVQLSSFKFNSGKYQSLTNYTKPISNKVRLDPNTLRYRIVVVRDDKYSAHADMTVTTEGSVMPTPVPTSKTVYSNEYTIQTDDSKYNTSIYYSWRNRSVGGEWRESAYCNWTSYEYNADTFTYSFKYSNSSKKVLGIEFARPYVDLKIDLISNKFGNVHIFTNAQNAYCNQLSAGQSYTYGRTINYPDFTETATSQLGSSGVGSFSLRGDRVDNSSNFYAALYSKVDEANVFSTSDFTSDTSPKKNLLLNAVNVSKPLIDNLDEGTLKVYNSNKTLSKWESDEVVDLGTNPTIDYHFQITNPTDARIRNTKYYCNVYLDLDGDGKFKDDEKLENDEYIITRVSGVGGKVTSGELRNYWINDSGDSDENISQNQYELQVQLGGDYIGIIPWKMEIVKVGDSSVHNSFVGYAYNKPAQPYELNVLQILPVTVNTSKGLTGTSYSYSPWSTDIQGRNMGEFEKRSLFLDNDAFGNLKGVKRNIINEDGSHYIQFEIGNDYIANIFVTSVYDLQGYSGTSFQSGLKNGITRQSLFDKFNTYDMLIIGFGDSYANGVSEELAQAINDYIGTGKSVLYTHDATDQFNNYYPLQRQADGYYLNLYVRDSVGQDKYGITRNILDHSEASRHNAGRGKANSPARFGYSDNIYTGASVFYHFDYTAVSYNRWAGTFATETTPGTGSYVAAKDRNNKDITGVNRYPAILYKDNADVWHIDGVSANNPTFIKDYVEEGGKFKSLVKTQVTTTIEGREYRSTIDTYGVSENGTQALGALVYYEDGQWKIAYDSNGDFIFYSSETYTGWALGYDENGHVLTSDNTYPANLEKVDGEWQIKYDLTGKPDKTSAIYKNKYGPSEDGTKWYGAYVYLDADTDKWYIGYDAKGNIITYGKNGYDTEDTDGNPTVTYDLTQDAMNTQSNNIEKYNSMGYQIAYKPKSARLTTVSQVHGFTTYTMARYTRAYKSGQVTITKALGATKSLMETRKVTQVNRGQITMYPFNLNTSEFNDESVLQDSEHLSINTTHEQYYTLDLTGTYHPDTNTYEDDYATVWYCLGGDGYENNVRNDCSNTYYMYRFGNVTYTGAGHTNKMSDEEAKLFINVIVAAHVKTGDSASIDVTDAETGATAESIIVPCTTDEVPDPEHPGLTKTDFVPDIKDEDNKFTLNLHDVQNNVMVRIWYTDSDGNRVEIYYDDKDVPHTVTTDPNGFIIRIDGEGPVSQSSHSNAGTIKESYTDKNGNTIPYTCNYAENTTTYTFASKNADGSTSYYYVTYLTGVSEESGNQSVSYITADKFTRATDIVGLHRLRQDLYYEITVYDDAGNPHKIIFSKKNNENKTLIISVDGDTSPTVCNMDYITSKFTVDKAGDRPLTEERLIGRPVSEYEIEYSIPRSVFEYLASIEDSANLKLYFQVLSCDASDAIYKAGKVTDISMVKSGLKTLV